MTNNPRHVQLLWVDQRVLIQTVLGVYRCEYLSVPKPMNIPPDTDVRGVYYDPSRDQLCFALEHPSFPEVAWGDVAPTISVEYQVVRLDLKKDTPDGK